MDGNIRSVAVPSSPICILLIFFHRVYGHLATIFC